MEESVYNIVKPDRADVPRTQLYRSKYPGDLLPTASTFGNAQTPLPAVHNAGGDITNNLPPLKMGFRRSHANMGLPHGKSAADPKAPLKAGSKAKRILTLKEAREQTPSVLQPSAPKSHLKPNVPKKAEAPVLNDQSDKNFVVANAVDTIMMPVRRPVPKDLDYLNKPDYGKVPEYLNSIKNDIAKEYEYIRTLHAAEEKQKEAKVRLLPEEEKQALLTALKQKWDRVNADYQTMTHMTKFDTVGKIRRKEQYESQLKAVENDINKLSRPYVFIDQNM